MFLIACSILLATNTFYVVFASATVQKWNTYWEHKKDVATAENPKVDLKGVE